MKILIRAGFLIALFLTGCSEETIQVPSSPHNHTVETADTIFGTVITDPYRWLEKADSPETRDWVQRQNAYCDTILQQVSGRRELRHMLTSLLKMDVAECPVEAGGRYFYTRYRKGEELPVLCVRTGLDGPERVLVDPHTMSPDHSISVQFMDISRDGSVISYAVRDGGVDETHIRFLDVESGRDYPEILPAGRYFCVQFSHDASAVYYVRHNRSGPRLFYHRLRTGMVHDQELFGGHLGPEHIMQCELSDNGRWFLISAASGAGGPIALYLADLERGPEFRVLVNDGKSRHYAHFAENQLIICTDWKAPRRRVMAASCFAPRVDRWVEVIPQQKEAVIQEVRPVGGSLLVQMLQDAQFTAALYGLNGTRLHDIDLGTMGSVLHTTGTWKSPDAFVQFTSFHIPKTVYRLTVKTGETSVWFRGSVPADPVNVLIQRVHFRSADGTAIPMFLLHKKGLPRNGTAPALLFGYGGFGASFVPAYDPLVTAIVNAGGVIAIPNIRGGGEFGESWHAAGRHENKHHTFEDFIAAAEYLIRERFTAPEHLGVFGKSHAGLLVGVSITERPDLFGAAVCRFPLLDMLRYHQFRVGALWAEEYGTSEDSLDFQILRSYSPYHNVHEGTAYPAVLFVSGDADTRFDPMHARKMTARMQACNGGMAPIMLRNHHETGAARGQAMSKTIDELVDTFSFLAWWLGIRFDTGV